MIGCQAAYIAVVVRKVFEPKPKKKKQFEGEEDEEGFNEPLTSKTPCGFWTSLGSFGHSWRNHFSSNIKCKK
jgi:hypothetical protein